MAKKTTRGAAPAKPKLPTFTLQKKMRALLPATERAGADDHLVQKSAGRCTLCGRPLDPADAEPDHYIPDSTDGETKLANLYLAHRTCNRSRGNLQFELARPVVEFKAFAEEKKAVTFDHVIERYLIGEDKPARQVVWYSESDGRVIIDWGSHKTEAPLFVDPATDVKYFFMDVPVSHILNDVEVQPRLIMYNHVRALALDFASRPVHEPSNCRFVPNGPNTAQLLQFDGQHKTTAQIILGRTHVPMKIYVAPDVAMVQALVLKIQQEIKKQPLTKSDTLAKLGDVIKRRLDGYLASDATPKTEQGFIAAQPKIEQKEVTREYQQELQRVVFFDDENELARSVKPGVANAPTTDKVIIERVIKPLIHPELLALDMEAAGGRDTERELILLVLNTIAAKMLPDGWNAPGSDVRKRRATNFFYQASIGWWMGELTTALRYVTQRIKATKPLFVEELDQKQRDNVVEVVEKLCDLSIWSTVDEEALKAMRSNTVKNLDPHMPKDAWQELLP